MQCSAANATTAPNIMVFSQPTCKRLGNLFLKAVVTTPAAAGTMKHAMMV
jgi:hypothetical protein